MFILIFITASVGRLNHWHLSSSAALQGDATTLDSASKAKSCAPIAIMCPDVQGTTSMEMLVGSQKRKARKTKITHLVRTADGSVSPAEGEWLMQDYIDFMELISHWSWSHLHVLKIHIYMILWSYYQVPLTWKRLHIFFIYLCFCFRG